VSLLVIGSEAEGASSIELKTGRAYGLPFTAKNTALVEALRYRTAAAGTATSVRGGICADEGGKPGAMLASSEGVATTGSAKETTYEATGLAASITAGVKYWLVLLPIGGTMRIKLGPGTEETGWRSGEGTTTVASATSWAITSGGVILGSPGFIAGKGIVVVSLVAGHGGGGGAITDQTTRQIGLVAGRGGGGGSATTPGEKGVKWAQGRGGGSGTASVSTKRVLSLAAGRGGGGASATIQPYGLAQVYGYGAPGSIWRVVEPLKATTPGSPIIIYLHESSSDEPTVENAPNVLPRVGETLAETEANARQLANTKRAKKGVEAGFACFVPAYRPISEGGPGNPGYQYGNADVDALIAWVKSHAEAWNGDPSKVCIIGGSFGVLIGLHEALKLNNEHNDHRYVVACAGLSGPIDIPSRVQGRDEEVAAKKAWEEAHPGFTPKELEEWETANNYPNTDIVEKLAKYIGVGAANLKEVGWLKGASAEQKAALKLAEELSPYYNLTTLSETMPYIWYAVSKKDLTPQQQGEEMSEAAAAHGQPGRYHFNGSVASGHAYDFYGAVEEEIYAYFRQAISPSVVTLASGRGGGRGSASVSTTRTATLVAGHGGGAGSATVPPTSRLTVVVGRGGGESSALVSTTRSIASTAGHGGGSGTITIGMPPLVGRGGGSGHVTIQTIRQTMVAGRGGGSGSAALSTTRSIVLAAGHGGGLGTALTSTVRSIASIAGRGGGRGSVSITRPAVMGRGGGSGHVTVQTIRQTSVAGRGGGAGSATAKGRVTPEPVFSSAGTSLLTFASADAWPLIYAKGEESE